MTCQLLSIVASSTLNWAMKHCSCLIMTPKLELLKSSQLIGAEARVSMSFFHYVSPFFQQFHPSHAEKFAKDLKSKV